MERGHNEWGEEETVQYYMIRLSLNKNIGKCSQRRQHGCMCLESRGRAQNHWGVIGPELGSNMGSRAS